MALGGHPVGPRCDLGVRVGEILVYIRSGVPVVFQLRCGSLLAPTSPMVASGNMCWFDNERLYISISYKWALYYVII